MNFSFLPSFVHGSQPKGAMLAYVLALLWAALTISPPVRGAINCAGKGAAHGPDAFFAGAAGAVSHAGMRGVIFGTKKPVPLFVHAGRPYAEKKSCASLPTARCCAHGVNDVFGVNAADAVRGNGVGNLLLLKHSRATRPQAAGTAAVVSMHARGMVVTPRSPFVFAAGHPREVTKAHAVDLTGPLIWPRGRIAKERRRV